MIHKIYEKKSDVPVKMVINGLEFERVDDEEEIKRAEKALESGLVPIEELHKLLRG